MIIELKKIEVLNNKRIVYYIDFTKKAAQYFSREQLYVEYSYPIEHVPESFQVIPFLVVVCHMAWFFDMEVIVNEVDSTFYNSLNDIKNEFAKMYPEIDWKGKITAKTVVMNQISDCQNAATLFSGGLDAITTYLRHLDKAPFIISALGADVKITNKEGCDAIVHSIKEFINITKTPWLNITTNFQEFLRMDLLNFYLRNKVQGAKGWWASIHHGVLLLGLCAPLCVAKDIGTLFIASSFSINIPKKAWGSTPNSDNAVRWTGTQVIPDAYELDRQDKVAYFAGYVSDTSQHIKLRVCWEGRVENCNKCEKCCRTIVGLLLEGLDPNNHGFVFDGKTLDYIKEKYLSGEWGDIRTTVEGFKRRIPARINYIKPEHKDFFLWLRNFNVVIKSSGYSGIGKELIKMINLKYFEFRLKTRPFRRKVQKLLAITPKS